jgi:hypothetical protein
MKRTWRAGIVGIAGLAAMGVHAANSPAPAKEPQPAVPATDRILESLRKDRPFLLVPGTQGVARLREKIRTDPLCAAWYASLKDSVAKTASKRPVEYRIPDGKRLLSVSRELKSRVESLGLLYLVDGDIRHAERAWAELDAAARFKDWNPSHFLDTAEMSCGFAIGYDWFFGAWTDAQRQTLRTAIVEFGLKPGLKVYAKNSGWAAGWNNWNQVCNGGLTLGALAIADAEPALAAQVVRHAALSVPIAMRHFAPDGGGVEGVTYWQYGSRYNVLMLEALETALGTDFGLRAVPGFEASGLYPIHMSGADGTTFNFADCGSTGASAAQHLWMGRVFGRPEFTRFRLDALRAEGRAGGVADLLAYDPAAAALPAPPLPAGRHFRVAECAGLRSAWNDTNALVLAIQAGDNRNLSGHRHLDLGSFIVEALGRRWIVDSGTEGETYQTHRHHNPRAAYYRVRAEGHNTLVLNPGPGPDQAMKAVAPITAFETSDGGGRAVVDLSAAYAPHARRAVRTFAMEGRSRVTVTDEVRADAPADLWWFAHTPAKIDLAPDRRTATLRIDDRRMLVTLAEPAEARFDVREARPLPTSPNPEKQAANKFQKLAVHLPGVTATRIVVRFEPEAAGR